MRPLFAAALAWVALVMPVTAGHAAILDQSGSGVVPVNDEKRLDVRGVEGEIILQRGEKGTVEFENTGLSRGSDAVPITLSTSGDAFALEPPAAAPTVKSRLRVLVPPGMKLVIDVRNAVITVSQLDSDLSVRGSRIRLDVTGLLRRLEAEVDGGNVTVQSVAQISLKGKDVDVKMDGVAGATTLGLTGGSARLTGLQSGLQAEFLRTRVGIDTVVGSADIRLQEGKAQIAGLRDGGRIVATVCPLVLTRLDGGLTVNSDSEVQVSDSRASLHIENSAGAVSGARLEGSVDVTTHGAAVSLSQVGGPVRVLGDELEVKLVDVAGSATVKARSSSVSMEQVAAVSIETDRGNVMVKGSGALVEVKSQNGNVQLLGMNGPVDVDAAGDLVEVELTAITAERDSRILNDGGEIRVTFLGGGGRVDASSRFGRVHSSITGVPVAEGESAAQGVVGGGGGGGGGGGRVVVVKASGDVHLLGSDAPAPAGQNP